MSWLGKFAAKHAEKLKEQDPFTNLGKALAMVITTESKAAGKGNTKNKNAAKATGKGQGKNGGANKAAAKTFQKQMPEGSWLCKRLNCDWAEPQKWNLPFRKSCGGCCRPKNEALSPPEYAKVKTSAEPSVSLNAKQKAAEKADTLPAGASLLHWC